MITITRDEGHYRTVVDEKLTDSFCRKEFEKVSGIKLPKNKTFEIDLSKVKIKGIEIRNRTIKRTKNGTLLNHFGSMRKIKNGLYIGHDDFDGDIAASNKLMILNDSNIYSVNKQPCNGMSYTLSKALCGYKLPKYCQICIDLDTIKFKPVKKTSKKSV